MKKEDILSAFSDVRDEYVADAMPLSKEKKHRPWVRIGALVASLALIVGALSLWLFLPYNNDPDAKIRAYTESEYCPLIQRLNAYTQKQMQYENNFDKYFSDISLDFGAFAPGDAMNGSSADDAENTTGAGADNGYVEVTDNQVQGVIESDLIKRSESHVYYLDGTELKVYSIAGEDSALVGSYLLPKIENAYSHDIEMYLSEDCTKVMIVEPISLWQDGARITRYDVLSLDVTDPANIYEYGRVSIQGGYLSSRMVEGKLLLIGEYAIGTPDYSDPSTFVPQINMGEGMQSLPLCDIIYPENLTSKRYTVITKLDGDTLTLDGCTAFLSYSDIIYVSNTSVYVTRRYLESTDTVSEVKTQISVLDYAQDTFTHRGSVTVSGYVLDQYSLDEYEGMLRVVTTTDKSVRLTSQSDTQSDAAVATNGTSASLYVIDLEQMKCISSVEDFAPRRETVRSVRFDGVNAYVCTSVMTTDPVFFFDLSDPENITYKDTGTIDGFSSSLINLGDGYLLGIGVGADWSTVKVEVYEEAEDGVASVAKYELYNATYSTEYKSYLINRELDVVGLGVQLYSGNYKEYYIILGFDGYDLTELMRVELSGGDARRATLIDGFVYFFGSDTFLVKELF